MKELKLTKAEIYRRLANIQEKIETIEEEIKRPSFSLKLDSWEKDMILADLQICYNEKSNLLEVLNHYYGE